MTSTLKAIAEETQTSTSILRVEQDEMQLTTMFLDFEKKMTTYNKIVNTIKKGPKIMRKKNPEKDTNSTRLIGNDVSNMP
jgi:hypothetical protein